MKIKIFLFLSLSIVMAFRMADTDLDTLVAKLQAYIQKNPTEKVFLHTDKPFYATGDTIWVKAYLVDGMFHQADSVSKPLYIRLTDADGKLVEKQVIKVENGYGYGNIALKDSMPEGNYQLLAYTNFMQNVGAEYFFKKQFAVYHPNKGDVSDQAQRKGLDLQFFPEGGYYVEGLRGRLAFKAIDAYGKGAEVRGNVYEVGDPDPVAELKAEHLGMGSVYLFPKAGKEYVAKVSHKGQNYEVKLPKAREKGIVMNVGNLAADNIKVTLSHNYPTEQISTTPHYLVIHARGIVRFATELPRSMDKSFYIQRSKIGEEGVLSMTVFDKDQKPIIERLVFNNLNKHLNIKINTDKPEYAPREAVKMNIEVNDAQGKPIAGHFSLAVTSLEQVADDALYTDHLQSYLLMSSDLRGTIEKPAYYFDEKNENRTQALDNLLLTQGWRKFVWENVLNNTPKPITYAFEQGLSIEGKVSGGNTKAMANTLLNFIVEAEGAKALANAKTNENAEFSIKNADFYGTAKVTMKTKQKGDVPILIQGMGLHEINSLPIGYTTRASKEEMANFLTKIGVRSKVSQALYANKATEANPNPSNNTDKKAKQEVDARRIVYGTPDFTLNITDQMTDGTNDFATLIRGRLPGATVNPEGMIMVRGLTSLTMETGPLMLLDGVPVDMSAIRSIQPKQIEAIDLLKSSAAVYGTRGAGGAINVLLRRGVKIDESFAEDGSKGFVKGYAYVREFYVPRYEATRKANALPDFRSTIYWNPAITTDATGKASVTFWNSDEHTTVKANLQGLNPKGGIGVATATYSVK